MYAAELTPAVIDAVRKADDVARYHVANRELDDIAELDRTLSELRERVVVELAAGHRVRLV